MLPDDIDVRAEIRAIEKQKQADFETNFKNIEIGGEEDVNVQVSQQKDDRIKKDLQ